jgi:hypothetical protein
MEQQPSPDTTNDASLPLPEGAVETPTNDAGEQGSRREFLCRSARKLAYAAPLVLLFKPKAACASNGSTLTYWDEGAGETKKRTYDEI